jgi:twitching motility protein PilT
VSEQALDGYLQALVARKGSDLILSAGAAPSIRREGHLEALSEERLKPADLEAIAVALLNPADLEALRGRREVDLAHNWQDRARLRINCFWQRGSIGFVMRLIPYSIPTPEELGLPAAVVRFTALPNGLVLVTGSSGSGKSTTMAALIDRINQERPTHIVTIEDPIEYVYRHRRSVVEQREVGIDTLTFADGLRSALRQSPDVVLIGEMRDLETIGAALTIAETGHVVFATLHTNDTAQAVDRIVDVFPPMQQQQVRIQLAGVLQGVVYQQLLRKVGGGRVAAFEVLVRTPAIQTLIRDAKTRQLRAQIETGGRDGMQTMERSLAALLAQGAITLDDALAHAAYPQELRRPA